MVDLLSKKFIGSVPDEWQLFSNDAQDYEIGQPIGHGASSIVYSAIYKPRSKPIPCALKVLDLDSLPPHSLRLLQRETTLMSLSKHPNVLRVRGTWMRGPNLFIAMRLMNKGSAADVMRYGWPGGMEEEVIRCILKHALEGLNYLHINGFIHRDVKAANLLIDDDGTVLLGDLGVAASLEDPTATHPPAQPRILPPSRPKLGKRKSFVGTPCWMSPELIQGHQYDSASDIWSFGITALELAQGRPPRSREPRGAVLLRIVQDPPPALDRENGVHKYSRAFKEIVESCLVKDPTKRPTAEQLLQTPFFKNAKKKSYLVGSILHDLPPLTARQERQYAPPPQVHNSVDSWDFSLSHTSSIRGARPLSTDSQIVSTLMNEADLMVPVVLEEKTEAEAQTSEDNESGPDNSTAPSVRLEGKAKRAATAAPVTAKAARMRPLAIPPRPSTAPILERSSSAPSPQSTTSSGSSDPGLSPVSSSSSSPARVASAVTSSLWRRLAKTHSASDMKGKDSTIGETVRSKSSAGRRMSSAFFRSVQKS